MFALYVKLLNFAGNVSYTLYDVHLQQNRRTLGMCEETLSVTQGCKSCKGGNLAMNQTYCVVKLKIQLKGQDLL